MGFDKGIVLSDSDLWVTDCEGFLRYVYVCLQVIISDNPDFDFSLEEALDLFMLDMSDSDAFYFDKFFGSDVSVLLSGLSGLSF